MPVIHQYKDSPGIYIVGKLKDGFITYQVSKAAENLITNAGFTSGSTISWALCKQLSTEGMIYTYKSGIEESHKIGGSDLTPNEQSIVDGLADGNEDIKVPDDIKQLIKDLAGSCQNIPDNIKKVNDKETASWIFESIRIFAESTSPNRFAIKNGYPVYHFKDSIDWNITHHRPSIFTVIIPLPDEMEVFLKIESGALDTMKMDRDEATDKHVTSLTTVLPSIFQLLDSLPDTLLDIGNWHFRDGKKVKLNREQTQRIGETLISLANSYGLEAGQSNGHIDSKGYAGYGRLKVEGVNATIPYTSRDFLDNGLKVGDKVRFEIIPVKYAYRGRDIEKA